MNTLIHIMSLINDIKFKDNWIFHIALRGETLQSEHKLDYLQILVKDTCSRTGEPYTWKSRKWNLSLHMTDSEIIQTAFLATMTAMEHEVRESFTFMNEPIFRPHFNIYELHKLSEQDKISKREELNE